MLRALLYLAYTIISCVSMALAVGAFVFYYFGQDLPDHKQLKEYNLPQSTYIVSDDESLITSYARERRIYLALDQMPQSIVHAFLAAEDKSFYENHGIDPLGILRAFMTNASGKHLSGGSTITQQLAKNFFLTNERTISRKIKEMILAFRLTKSLSKDRILELYLNKIYMGNGTYGVAAAAMGYFNKSIEDLNVGEVAMLAALPKSPSKLDPWRTDDHSALLQRRNWVISRMLEEGYINKYEAIAAKERTIALAKPEGRYINNAYYFGDEVRKEIESLYGHTCLYECGLTVHTTLNTHYQAVAHAALRSGLEKFDKRQGYRGPIINIKDTMELFDEISEKFIAEHTMDNKTLALVTEVKDTEVNLLFAQGKTGQLNLKDLDWVLAKPSKRRGSTKVFTMSDIINIGDVILVGNNGVGPYRLYQIPLVNGAIVVLDTKTGRVLSMVGGYDYKNNKFNRATQAKRQPGSVFKPFVYLTALERQVVKPNTIIADEAISVEQGSGLPRWSPRNFKGKYYGQVPVRRGLEQSMNAVTVKLILMAGLSNVLETAKKFGVSSGSGRHLSVALGAEATTPLSVVNGYAIIAGGGRKLSPTTIELIQDSKGIMIHKRDTRECNTCKVDPNNKIIGYPIPPDPEDNREIIADPIACYQVLSMMEGVVEHGTGRGIRMQGKHIAGKTGTTNDSKDTWFVGLTNEVTVGVYVGYDEPRSMGESATGSRVALPIVKEFIENIQPEAGPFEIPLGVTTIKINRFTGNPSHKNDAIQEAFRMGTEPSMYAHTAEGPEEDLDW